MQKHSIITLLDTVPKVQSCILCEMPHAVHDETSTVSYRKGTIEIEEQENKAQCVICPSPIDGSGSFCVFVCPVFVCGCSDLWFFHRTLSSEVQKLCSFT